MQKLPTRFHDDLLFYFSRLQGDTDKRCLPVQYIPILRQVQHVAPCMVNLSNHYDEVHATL
ncbi:hypothetical protein [Candidatus Brocadia sapporoensis]|uniref:hypothetical protein n=1 Tax=Candidatus Brocadia sapporoensis TaxID=392547 RepID=UPI001E5C8F69|nr:hypothetical protein [Candidatus Brocadia sapporoensis]MDG6005709.1 hypothetical protein [Candidatus Brocadia sp.]